MFQNFNVKSANRQSHRVAFPLKTCYGAKPFYLIHSDLWGPSRVNALSRKKWFVTFIDDRTHLYLVYLLSKKSKVEHLIKEFCSMIKNQFQTKIGILCTNNGTKYFNECLGKFVKEKYIIHQSTCRETPKQNGIVDQKNRHLLEVACAIMFFMHIPKYLWREAILTSSYLINRMPTQILKFETPLNYLKKKLFPRVV